MLSRVGLNELLGSFYDLSVFYLHSKRVKWASQPNEIIATNIIHSS